MEPTVAPAVTESGSADKEVVHRVVVKLCVKTFWTRSAEEIAHEAAEGIHAVLPELDIKRMPLMPVVARRKRRVIGHYHVKIAFELQATPTKLEQLHQMLRRMLKKLKKKHWSIRKTPLHLSPLVVPELHDVPVKQASHDPMEIIALVLKTSTAEERQQIFAGLGPQQA